jgi:signal transduction histidine kinase
MLSVTNALAVPIRELIAGTEQVHAGNLDVRVPIIAEDEIGQLAVSFNGMVDGLRDGERLRDEVAELNESLGRALADVRASQARLLSVEDDERRRMEREISGGVQKTLDELRRGVARLPDLVSDPDTRALVARVDLQAASALAQLQDLASGIYPASLETDGLRGALTRLAERSSLPTRVDCDGVNRLPKRFEVAVYFCCAEALTNAAKHAGPAVEADITVRLEGDVLLFTVADTGAGFEHPAGEQGSGLQGMVDRIGALGGRLAVDSSPGRGTTVSGSVPLSAAG